MNALQINDAAMARDEFENITCPRVRHFYAAWLANGQTMQVLPALVREFYMDIAEEPISMLDAIPKTVLSYLER